MNATDIVRYGNQTLLRSIEGVEPWEWEVPGAVGTWSIKDILSHLTSYERLIGEVLGSFLGEGLGPYATQIMELGGHGFNERQVADRAQRSPEEIVGEYREAYEQSERILERIPEEKRREVGTLPWYGPQYALDDYLVYTSYGHKREHSAQIDVMRDRLRTGETATSAAR